MKKKILASLLLSTVMVSQAAVLTTAHAETTDDKIAAQDNKISNLTAQQQEAQKQVDQVQEQVSAIQTEQSNLQSENDRLQEESKKLEGEITELSKNIVSRNDSLQKQARSAQTNGAATNYINTIVNSKSITEAISRVAAMSEIVSAQKADKKAISEKQVANNDAINTVIANQQKLADDAQSLTTKQAELKAAELNLAAEKATAEDEKASLLEKKAAAEAEAKAAAEAEAAYKAKQASQQQKVVASGNTTFTAEVQAVSTTSSSSSSSESSSSSASAESTSYTPAPVKQHPTYSTNASSYPVGQCTWGVKTLAPWAGDYWGNGGQWAASAAAAGFRTGSTPQVGAIACWDDGGYGHVAVVTAVESSTRIQVSECNYDGSGTQPIGNYRGWFNPTASRGTVRYIYPN